MNDSQCVCVLVIALFISTVVLEPSGNGKGCYYKGAYHHGNWSDGCEFNCTCLDAEKGHYKCQTRCPVYTQLPSGCVLKLPSGEACCKQPDCRAITSHYNGNGNSSGNDNGNNATSNNNSSKENGNTNNENGNGNNSNGNSNSKDNANNSSKDNSSSKKSNSSTNDNGNGKNSNGNSNSKDNGNYISKDNGNRKEKNNSSTNDNSNGNGKNSNGNSNSNDNGNNGSKDNGSSKKKNSSTNDNGNGKNGNNKGTQSSNVKSRDKKDNIGNGSSKNDNGSGGNAHILNGSNAGNSTRNGEEKGCLYNGKFHQGNWTDGCDFNCSCEDPVLGIYSCKKRCREYKDVDLGCVLEISSIDMCCMVPVCETMTTSKTLVITVSLQEANNKTTPFTTLPPIVANIIEVKNDSPNIENKPMYITNNNVTLKRTADAQRLIKDRHIDETYIENNQKGTENIQPNTGGKHVDVPYETYQNSSMDVISAKKTQELAVIFSRFGPIKLFTVRKSVDTKPAIRKDNSIQSTTSMKLEHSQSAAPKVGMETIETTTANITENSQENVTQNYEKIFSKRTNETLTNSSSIARQSGERNSTAVGGVCSYEGWNFTQGERWYDGCDFICSCEDATRGIYKCRSRCEKYNTLPVGCILRQSMSDNCCQIPDCRFAVVNKYNQQIISPIVLELTEETEATIATERKEKSFLSQEEPKTTHVPKKTQESILKRMFNERIKLRNLESRSEHENTVESTGFNISDLNSKNQVKDNLKFPGEIFAILPKENLVKDIRNDTKSFNKINTDLKIGDGTPQRQEIITPVSVNRSDFNTEIVDATRILNESKSFKDETHRTIATQTGIYKVRKRDGLMTVFKLKPATNGFRRKVVTAPRQTSPAVCKYKNYRFKRGDTWVDGCELTCTCRENGQYSCHKRCPDHTRVPDGCTVAAPKAGQCCSSLVCQQTQQTRP